MTGCAIVRHYGDHIINLISDQIDPKRAKKNTFLDKIRLFGNVLGILIVLFCTSQIHGKLPKEISNQILAGCLPGTLICFLSHFLISAIKPKQAPPRWGVRDHLAVKPENPVVKPESPAVKPKNPSSGQSSGVVGAAPPQGKTEENETGFGFSGPSGED